MNVLCPHCNALNRMPPERAQEGPNCGACHQALFPGQAIELDAQSFDRFLVKNDLPVVVDFWADWCGPCKMMAPHFAQAAKQLRGVIQFAKLDTDAAQQIAGRYAIRSIPTMVLFQNGQERKRLSGAQGAAQIAQWAREA